MSVDTFNSWMNSQKTLTMGDALMILMNLMVRLRKVLPQEQLVGAFTALTAVVEEGYEEDRFLDGKGAPLTPAEKWMDEQQQEMIQQELVRTLRRVQND